MNIIIIIVGLISILWADFGPNVNISEGLGTLNKRPDITIDINNIIHVVWVNADDNANVYYARSEDHGNTFSAPAQVNSVDGYAIEITYSGPKIESVGNTIHIICQRKAPDFFAFVNFFFENSARREKYYYFVFDYSMKKY